MEKFRDGRLGLPEFNNTYKHLGHLGFSDGKSHKQGDVVLVAKMRNPF